MKQSTWQTYMPIQRRSLLRTAITTAFLIAPGSIVFGQQGNSNASVSTGTAQPAQQPAKQPPRHGDPRQQSSPQPSSGRTLVEEGRTVSLRVADSTIGYVVRALSKQANRPIVYKSTDPTFAKRITVRISDMEILKALAVALNGTGLSATIARDGETIVIQNTKGAELPQETSIINGRVVDSVTKKGLAGASVTLVGTKLTAVTTAEGRFSLRGAPIGKNYLDVKLFGYRALTVPVIVNADGITQMSPIVLRSVPTALTEVVTTATGVQRRVEVGNDVVSINVDSVMKVAPVTSVSDLLATRVPGMSVIKTSGVPGAPSRIRIRGLSSLNGTNDPIVYVDGIRIYSTQGSNGEGVDVNPVLNQQMGRVDRSRNLAVDPNTTNAYAPLVPSPIDQIDPNSIETIEVLKGPSAVSLYGTDAANGVILIKTRRGRTEPARWEGSVTMGTRSLPGKWPMNYWMWGTPLFPDGTEGEGSVHCPVLAAAARTCRADSLMAYQAQNDPQTTMFGRGSLHSMTGGVSGGVKTVRYSLRGSVQKQIGYGKIPDIDVALIKQNGGAVPGWQRRPEADLTRSATVGIDLEPRDELYASFTQMLFQRVTDGTPLSGALRFAGRIPPPGQLMNLSGNNDPNYDFIVKGSGILQAVVDYERRNSTRSDRTTNAVTVNYAPTKYLSFKGEGGIDVVNRNDKSTLDRDACKLCAYSLDTGGRINTTVGSVNKTTATLQMTSKQNWKGLSFTTSIGGNYVGEKISDLSEFAYNIPTGATSSRGAGEISSSSVQDERRTAGYWAETVLGIADQFYLPIGIRSDGGSGSGAGVMTKLPRLQFSYVLSNQPFIHHLPVLNRLSTLRLRSAVGYAARSPSATAELRLVTEGAGQNYGIDGKTLSLYTAGNPRVRPERTREFEGGVDIGFADERVQLDMTYYRKTTLDAHVKLELPWSLGSIRTPASQMNVGVVSNTGMELELNTRILENQNVGWTANVTYAQNANLVKRLGRDALNVPGSRWLGFRYVEGYPMNGYWGRPILSYDDVNRDGVIDGKEIALSDSMMYVGTPDPKYEATLNNTVTLMRRVTVSTTMTYKHQFNQFNETLTDPTYSRANNDPNTPLATQALYLVAGCQRFFSNSTCNSYVLARRISVLRFHSLSISYILPQSLLRRAKIDRQVTLSLQGSNLGLISNYTGKDPNVSSSSDDLMRDEGMVPEPRSWQLVLRF